MPFAKVSCGTIHYKLEGNIDAPVVALSNSLGTTLSMWDQQASAFLERFRVLRYDTRGHGGSSVPAGGYSLEELGGDVLELLDALRIDQAHVCGISLGGMTALWLAIHAGDRVAGIVAASTAAKIGDKAGWTSRIEQVSAQGTVSIADATMERWFTAGFRAREPERVSATRTMFCAANSIGYAGCCAALRDADLTAAVASIDCPALVISGAYDPVTAPADGHFLQGQIASAVYRELNAAHLSNIEAAAEFNAAVERFLASP